MKWDYTKICVYISVPRHIKELLNQLNNKTPKKSQHQPYPAPERTYGADAYKMKLIDMSTALSTEQVR